MLDSASEYIIQFSFDLMSELGYIGVASLIFIETIIVPIPSELILSFAGFLVAQGELRFFLVILASTIGNVAGSILVYWIGISGGRWFIEKYGKYVFISQHDILHAEKWFDKYGSRAVFFGRFIPAVRTLISLPAGIVKMNFWKFFLYSALGGLLWNTVLVYIGMKAGENWDFIRPHFEKFDSIVIVLLVAGGIWYGVRHIRKRHLTHD